MSNNKPKMAYSRDAFTSRDKETKERQERDLRETKERQDISRLLTSISILMRVYPKLFEYIHFAQVPSILDKGQILQLLSIKR